MHGRRLNSSSCARRARASRRRVRRARTDPRTRSPRRRATAPCRSHARAADDADPTASRADSAISARAVAEAETELREAVDELRRLASGIHPAVLTDYGLTAAIQALAETSTTAVRLDAPVERRYSSAVETAAYMVVAAAAKVGPARVSIARRGNTLVVDVKAARQPEHLVDIEDRLGALDGALRTEHDGRRSADTGGDPVRVVIADDSMLVREGLARLLAENGCDVVATSGMRAPARRRRPHQPDVAIVDIKMPPTHSDEGIAAALQIRAPTRT